MKTPTPTTPASSSLPTLPGFQLPGKGRPPLLWDSALTQSGLDTLNRLPDLFTWYRVASANLTYALTAPHLGRQPVIPASMAPLLEQARAYVATSLPAQMDAVIMTAFPQYRLEDLQAMPVEDLLELYAHAEWSIRNVRGIPLQLVDAQGNPVGATTADAASQLSAAAHPAAGSPPMPPYPPHTSPPFPPGPSAPHPTQPPAPPWLPTAPLGRP